MKSVQAQPFKITVVPEVPSRLQHDAMKTVLKPVLVCNNDRFMKQNFDRHCTCDNFLLEQLKQNKLIFHRNGAVVYITDM